MSCISLRSIAASVFTPPQSNRTGISRRPVKNCAKRSSFAGKSVSSASRRRNLNTMSNGIRTSTSDEGVHVFEQEALVEGQHRVGDGGIEALLNSLSKWVVAALFSAIVLWRHDAAVSWAAMGAVLNSLLSVALKKILNQERPISTLRSDPGMPSSHAQSIFYAVTFISLSMVECYGMNVITTIVAGLVFMLGSYFSWLRVSQQLHTLNQVIVGSAIGTILSILWLWLWDSLVSYAFAMHLWVRIIVIIGSSGFCVGFLYHVYSTWIGDERP